jgi:uncharacterized protein (TIGR03435 family)
MVSQTPVDSARSRGSRSDWDRGSYDFALNWTPDRSQPAGPGESGDGRASASAPDGPSVFTAIQDQLGLKLKATKGPVEIIVSDHAEKAAAN